MTPRTPLERFASKCRHDPTTGCVLWTGGTTAGRGNSARYGSFWYEGRRWAAHRWAAIHVHGLDVADAQVGHCCPSGPQTLCVEHLAPQTQAENVAERNTRVAQSNAEKRHWLFVSLGFLEPDPEPQPDPDALPYFPPPEWLRPYLSESGAPCPF